MHNAEKNGPRIVKEVFRSDMWETLTNRLIAILSAF